MLKILEIFEKYEITIMKTNSGGSIAPRQVHRQTRRMEQIKAHDHTEYPSSCGLIPIEEPRAGNDKGCRAPT